MQPCIPQTNNLHKRHFSSKSVEKWGTSNPHVYTWTPVCTHPFFLPSMRGEVIHWDLHTLALLEFAKSVNQQAEIKGVWMVKVVIVISSQQLLFGRQNLEERRHSRQSKVTPLTSIPASGVAWWLEMKADNWKVGSSNQTRVDPTVLQSHTQHLVCI